MKYTPGPLGANMSGSLGATVASRNRYGTYFRQKASPVNPNSLRQQNVRALFTTMVNAWNDTLTAAERVAWDTYAGNVLVGGQFITGQNHYIRTNVNRGLIAEPRIDIAPITFNTGNPVTGIQVLTDLTADTIGVNLAVTALAVTALINGLASDDGDMLLYLGAPVNPTINFFKGPYQLAAVEAVADAGVSVNFLTLFTALLSDSGDPAVGQRRSIKLRILYDDGRLSDSYDILAPVVADSI